MDMEQFAGGNNLSHATAQRRPREELDVTVIHYVDT